VFRESGIRGWVPAGCFSGRVLFRECGFLNSQFALKAVKPVGVALTSDAAQVAGLGRIYFELFLVTDLRRFARIKRTPSFTATAIILALDNSLFVLLY
jgi:hypothetical protein